MITIAGYIDKNATVKRIGKKSAINFCIKVKNQKTPILYHCAISVTKKDISKELTKNRLISVTGEASVSCWIDKATNKAKGLIHIEVVSYSLL